MKTDEFVLALILLMPGCVWAQQTANTGTAAPVQAATASSIPDGTVARVEMKQDVETNKAKLNDLVKLEVVEDGKDAKGQTAKGPDGKPVLPRKTKLIAKVSSVKPSTKQSKDAKLSLVVVGATFPNGKTVPFLGVVMGPFRVSQLSTGIDTRGGGAASKENLGLDTPQVPSGIQGVNIEKDPRLGTVLVAPMNFSVDKGTEFYVGYVDLAAHRAEIEQPPAK